MSIEEIKKYLKTKNITYQELSDRSNVPLNTIKNIFRGKTENPRIDTMNAIETALGIKKATLFTEDDRKSGVVGTRISIEITPDEDDLLYLYRQIGKNLGETGQKAFKEMGETLLAIKK